MGEGGIWEVNTSGVVPHTGMRDVLVSLLVRSDRKLHHCNDCLESTAGTHFFQCTKVPLRCRLPPVLSLDLSADHNEGKEVTAEEEFELGGHTYTLVAIVFGGRNHFNCRVRLNNVWYEYDDMGVQGQWSNGRLDLRMKKVGGTGGPMEGWARMGPRVTEYRYVRTGLYSGVLDKTPVELDSTRPYPVEKVHFNEMCAVLDGTTV